MPFFAFDQNNSGGSYSLNANRGIGKVVVIEAENASEANERAEEIGLYFDGKHDCDCCGNRWYAQWVDEDGIDFETILHWDWRGEVYVHTLKGKMFIVQVDKHESTKRAEQKEYERRNAKYKF
jgi:hypothetical protein